MAKNVKMSKLHGKKFCSIDSRKPMGAATPLLRTTDLGIAFLHWFNKANVNASKT
jgi:hypothetical protein